MPCILSIETSTNVCSVVLAVDGKIVFNKVDDVGMSHASLLGRYVGEAVSFARENCIKLQSIAISKGPGSYTGLRIGASLAKGLCYGLNLSLISISSLEIMTNLVFNSKMDVDYYCPMIDARRMEVYSAIYDKHLNLENNVSAEIIDEKSFHFYLSKGKVLFFGNGSDKCIQMIKSQNAIFLSGIVPLASSMVFLAENAFAAKKFENVVLFEPFYLKEFIATVSKNKVIK